MSSQGMGIIKEESLTVCPPWTHISIDFAGPILVKDTVNLRAKKKCWIIVYCCRSTKAVELIPSCGYDTQSFMLKHQEFVYRRGAPVSIVSDRGTQLVSAGKLLAQKDMPDKWNWSKITSENSASNWTFVPIGSPHFNGLPESTVKVLKRTLELTLSPGVVLTYPELVTLLWKIAYTVNSRPLGLLNTSQDSQQEDNMVPLTPNMLLLGRSSSFSPCMEFSENERFSARLAYVSQVEQEWWDRWIRVVLPTLFSYKRWKVKQKNLEVGELVMLRYPGNYKDDYCIAKVTAVHPSEDGLVRQVTVEYRKKNSREVTEVYKSKPPISEKVAIHRLHRLHLVDEELQHRANAHGVVAEGIALDVIALRGDGSMDGDGRMSCGMDKSYEVGVDAGVLDGNHGHKILGEVAGSREVVGEVSSEKDPHGIHGVIAEGVALNMVALNRDGSVTNDDRMHRGMKISCGAGTGAGVLDGSHGVKILGEEVVGPRDVVGEVFSEKVPRGIMDIGSYGFNGR